MKDARLPKELFQQARKLGLLPLEVEGKRHLLVDARKREDLGLSAAPLLADGLAGLQPWLGELPEVGWDLLELADSTLLLRLPAKLADSWLQVLWYPDLGPWKKALAPFPSAAVLLQDGPQLQALWPKEAEVLILPALPPVHKTLQLWPNGSIKIGNEN